MMAKLTANSIKVDVDNSQMCDMSDRFASSRPLIVHRKIARLRDLSSAPAIFLERAFSSAYNKRATCGKRMMGIITVLHVKIKIWLTRPLMC